MNYLVLDVETTIKNKGSPFTNENQLCYTGTYSPINGIRHFNHLQQGLHLPELQSLLDSATVLVCFNAKFDCHWLERSGYSISHLRIWDAQYAAFLFSNQLQKYPSLQGECSKVGLGSKLDIIATEYWEKGIDTPQIPTELLLEYLTQDIELTHKLYLHQVNLFQTTEKSKYRLFLLHMADQHVLREIERNGIIYDVETSLKAAEEAEHEIQQIEAQLRVGYEAIPLNFDSSDHVSAYLYGGTIVDEFRVPIGVYKTGAKVGQPRYKVMKNEYKLPRIFKPLPRSELQKEGYWSTDETTLRQLRGSKESKRRLSLLDKRAKLEKLRGTYYKGLPKKIVEMEWSNNCIHSSLNQCSVVTGRLSSTNPNQQNLAPEAKQLCISRYGDT